MAWVVNNSVALRTGCCYKDSVVNGGRGISARKTLITLATAGTALDHFQLHAGTCSETTDRM